MSARALARPVILCLLATGVPLAAQSYQTSFSEVKFDRAKTPATFHAGAEVDSATGAVSMNIPLGPGIGSNTVFFRPVLACRWAPQVTTQAFIYQDPYGNSTEQYYNTELPSKASLHPGVFNLRIYNLPASPFSENYTVLGGPTGVFSDDWSNPRPVIDKAALLSNFGYSGFTVTRRPRRTTHAGALPPETDAPEMSRVTSTGGLVLGLADAAHPERTITELVGVGSTTEYTFPSLLLMIEGDRGYEFEFIGLIENTKTVNQGSGQFETLIVHEGRYRLSKIVSRFDEALHFTYTGDSYQVSWWKRGSILGPTLSVQLQVQTPGDPEVRVNVTYAGITGVSEPPSGYLIHADLAKPTNPDPITADPEDASEKLVPRLVTQLANNETIQFSYAPGAAYPPGNPDPAAHGPSVLRTITYPTRSLTFDWSVYPYVRNKATQDFGGYSWDRLQAFMYGVDTITEQGGGQTRVTSHSRWVPRLTGDMAGHTWAAPWVSKTFMDTITYPDGRKAVHHFVEPLDTSGAGGTPDQQMQTLAHLKHLIKQSEYIGPLGGSPHTVQTFDEWSLRKVGNPDGLPQVGSLPYPIHTSTVHALEGFVVDERKNYWDSVNYGWGLSTRRVTQTGQADLNRDVQRGWKFVPELWLGPRVESETPTGQPRVDTVYLPGTSLVDSVTINPDGSPSLKTSFSYVPGTANVSHVQVQALSGATGTLGVSYGYDAYGFMNAITLDGAPGSLLQENDPLGRPLSQTDLNGLRTSFTRDAVGRLTGITPPGGETPTVIGYPDLLHATVTQGPRTTTYAYTPFGKLASIQKPTGEVKTFTYDIADRLTFESVWGHPSPGTSTQYDDPLGRPTRITDPLNVVTVTSYSGTNRTVTVNPGGLNLTTTFSSDGLGRLLQVTDALGQTTSYQYDDADRIRQVSQASVAGLQLRTWSYNALGWLTSLTQPESGTTTYSDFTVSGKPQTTDYAGRVVNTTYNDWMSRVKTVTAVDGSVSQSYAYDQGPNGLGKLASATDGAVTTTFSYTGLNGRLGELTTWVPPSPGAAAQSFTQSFAYNADGFRTSAMLPSGRSLSYPYSAASGRGTGVSEALLGALATVTGFNEADLPTGITFARGLKSVFSYDGDQTRLAGMAHQAAGGALLRPASSWTYAYDPAGRMIGDGTDAFEYDKLNRLAKATVKLPEAWGVNQTLVQDYDYDAFGNQTKSSTATSPNPVPVGLQANLNNFEFSKGDAEWLKNRIPAFTLGGSTGTGALYDAQGNLTRIYKQAGQSQRTVTLAYDALGRVSQTVDYERNVTEKYAYTSEGLRTRIETYAGTAPPLTLQKVQVKLYNDQRQLVSEYEAVVQ
ncbi:MAG: hypothetical protein U0P81_07375 [Holophagaceae bacterium]